MDMRIRECSTIFLRDIFVPWITIAAMLCLAYPICNKAEGMDFFLLWIIVGFPFGTRRMMLWLIPHNYGISGSIGVIGLDCIIGGIIGGFVVIFMIIKSIAAFLRVITTMILG